MSPDHLHPHIDHLQERFIEAVFEPELIDDVLKRFADFCGAEIAHLMIADGERTLLESRFTQGVDPSVIKTEPHFQHINPRVLAIPSMRQGKSTQDKHFIDREKIAKDQTYQELILPAGLGHFSAVPIILKANLTAGIALHRPFDKDEFNSDVIARHEYAASVCAPVFNLVSLLRNENAKSALQMFGNTACAVLQSNGRCIDHNQKFEEILRADIAFIDGNRKLRFGTNDENKMLNYNLRSSITGSGDHFVIKGALGDPLFVATVVPAPKVGMFGVRYGAFLLVMRPIRTNTSLNARLLKEAFELTNAEIETAELLYHGKSLVEISQSRGVSRHTTQSSVKRILAKTECHRQAELVSVLSAFAVI